MKILKTVLRLVVVLGLVMTNGVILQCIAAPAGPFDAWDLSRSIADRNISTKIVAQDFTLTIASLNSTQTGLEVKPEGVKARYRLIDINTGAYKTGEAFFDAHTSLSITSSVFNVSSAIKNVKVEFKYCADYNGTDYTLKSDGDCSSECFSETLITSNNPCFRKMYSSDAFAIRPNDFNSTIALNQKFLAGRAESLTFRADPFGATTGAVDYNETQGSSFVVDVNISDATKSCHDRNISFSPSIGFTNGNATDFYMLNNVGDFNVTVHEVNDAEFASIDRDDSSDAVRLIAPFETKITVVPDHFAIDGSLTNGSNGFTYLSNFEASASLDKNISALLDLNITAKTAGNGTTTNYTSNCYAKDGNVSLAVAMPTIAPSGNLTKLLWYDYFDNSSQGNFTLNTSYAPLPYLASRFASGDFNGTASIRYRLNFDRNQTKPVDPFVMTINDVNVTDTDLVDGTKTLTANNTASYVYGRVVPRGDINVFGFDTFVATAYYEVYNAPAMAGVTSSLVAPGIWFINTTHNHTSDGNATISFIDPASGSNNTLGGTTGYANGVETYSFTTPFTIRQRYRVHVDTDAWLWHLPSPSVPLPYLDPDNITNLDCLRHPCFNISFRRSISNTGSAKTESESQKNNKNSTTSGGWNTTREYAPSSR